MFFHKTFIGIISLIYSRCIRKGAVFWAVYPLYAVRLSMRKRRFLTCARVQVRYVHQIKPGQVSGVYTVDCSWTVSL